MNRILIAYQYLTQHFPHIPLIFPRSLCVSRNVFSAPSTQPSNDSMQVNAQDTLFAVQK